MMALRFDFSRFSAPDTLLLRADKLIAEGERIPAFRLLARAAERGSTEACFRVGRAYLEGSGVPVSASEGMRWLERAARDNHVAAQALLAAMLLRGLAGAAASLFAGPVHTGTTTAGPVPIGPDFAAARRWAEPAAAAGSADGQAVLAYILTAGPEDMRDPVLAEDFYQRSAKAGCPQGALGLAVALAKKSPDAAAQPEVVRWLRVAAAAGLATARYMLAELTERGLGTDADPAAAAVLYLQAAEQGHRSAQARYGAALMRGRGVARNVQQGESWLRRAALAGDPDAAALVGDLYARKETQGETLPPNYLEAALWYRRAAEAGHRTAAHALGMLYLTGAGVPLEREEAARWFRISAERGDPAAQADLGNLALGGGGTPEDQVRTYERFAAAAEKGDLVAAFNLSVCLSKGVGVARDAALAAHWLRRAAGGDPEAPSAPPSGGLVNAQYWYGKMLIDGSGVPADAAAGHTWIARAAEAGMVEAEVMLGGMLTRGDGGPKDHAAAQVWFTRAAERGHAGAMFALAALLGGGHDVPMDRIAAQRWFRAAAERGHGHAQMMLGRYLARGLAGERDPAAARIWLEKARDQGVGEAKGDLAALPPAQPPAQPPAPTLATG